MKVCGYEYVCDCDSVWVEVCVSVSLWGCESLYDCVGVKVCVSKCEYESVYE